MVKEPLLQRDSIPGVEFSPVFQPVDLKPLLLGGRLRKPLEISARVKPLTPPIG